jgi:hypothetical protein
MRFICDRIKQFSNTLHCEPNPVVSSSSYIIVLPLRSSAQHFEPLCTLHIFFLPLVQEIGFPHKILWALFVFERLENEVHDDDKLAHLEQISFTMRVLHYLFNLQRGRCDML